MPDTKQSVPQPLGKGSTITIGLTLSLLCVSVYGMNIVHGIDTRQTRAEERSIASQDAAKVARLETNSQIRGLSKNIEDLVDTLEQGLVNGSNERLELYRRISAIETYVATAELRLSTLEKE